MNRIEKALTKLSRKESLKMLEIFDCITDNHIALLDVKKLKGSKNVFRVRSGNIRIVFRKDISGNNHILSVGRRNETTYEL